ncbi:hypothetical protein Asulf_01464 [Archaeoglobus sulfaticallidus PM70-1]|uniref:Uncharacterized protein n=1 Tax=Archaeoglobus sulfaticallidus PM70-1 TaxID=387631 RepID=N0BGP2_9EURY|nr:hypothetical protein [Archaeoglobus sulfaticallidus]AGK61447.1 hypothetical protein Asulf_01464 [Archaeoglobus sulfaticallidus PM70-1]
MSFEKIEQVLKKPGISRAILSFYGRFEEMASKFRQRPLSAGGDSAQISADYLVGIALFLFGVTLAFTYVLNIAAFQESNKNQYIAESISELVLDYLHQKDAYRINAINTTKLHSFLASSHELYSLLNQTQFHVNITVKNLSSQVIGSVGELAEIEDYGYVERIAFNYANSSEIYIIEVRVW